MPARLPQSTDFPSSAQIAIIPPPGPSLRAPVNVLLLLHGIGDTDVSFTNLGRQLNLPETVVLSIQAPSPIPSLFTGSDTPAFHWGDDVLFDEAKGEIDLDAGFTKSRKLLWDDVIRKGLVEKCGFRERNVLMLGFGQGGMAALNVAATAGVELGGVVSVGGRLPATASTPGVGSSSSSSGGGSVKFRTPVLILGGSRSSQVTKMAIEKLKTSFVDVQYVKWSKEQDTMPRNREEMLPIMQFFARRLQSRAGVPEGSVEIGA